MERIVNNSVTENFLKISAHVVFDGIYFSIDNLEMAENIILVLD